MGKYDIDAKLNDECKLTLADLIQELLDERKDMKKGTLGERAYWEAFENKESGLIPKIRKATGLDLTIYLKGENSESFYITQRLSSEYDDTILGAIAKGMEEAESGPSSNWVAYNVTDGGLRGDERCIIHCNEENPFSEAGIYTISYVDIGDTTPVTDSKGFTSNPPLYYMVTDTSTFEEDEEKITEIEEKETTARDAIVMKITGEGEDDPGENSDESEAGEEQDSSTDGDYILEGSDSRYITEKEVENLSEAERRLAKNEIYARHGRMFDSADLQDYFESKSWYKGTVKPSDFDESVLNKYEKANIDLISSME